MVQRATAEHDRLHARLPLGHQTGECLGDLASGTFGGDMNTIHLVTASGVEDWPPASKRDVAERLARRIAAHLEEKAAE